MRSLFGVEAHFAYVRSLCLSDVACTPTSLLPEMQRFGGATVGVVYELTNSKVFRQRCSSESLRHTTVLLLTTIAPRKRSYSSEPWSIDRNTGTMDLLDGE